MLRKSLLIQLRLLIRLRRHHHIFLEQARKVKRVLKSHAVTDFLVTDIDVFQVFTGFLGLFQIKKVDDGITRPFFKKTEQVRGRIVELVGNIFGGKGFIEIAGQEIDNGVH